jgi:hypothetical protein
VTDVQHFQTNDGGDIRLDGDVITDDGIASAFYLSLFGGEMDDDGSEATESKQWWGNFIEGEPTRRYRSQTQSVLRSMPATSGNLRRVEAAIAADLTWAVDTGLATYAAGRARLPRLSMIQIDLFTEINGETITISLPPMPWGVSGS